MSECPCEGQDDRESKRIKKVPTHQRRTRIKEENPAPDHVTFGLMSAG